MNPRVGTSGTCAFGRTNDPRLVCEAPPEVVEPGRKMFDGPRARRPCLQSQVASAFVHLGSRPIIIQHTAVSREMSLVGQSRRSGCTPIVSGLPLTPDTSGPRGQVNAVLDLTRKGRPLPAARRK